MKMKGCSWFPASLALNAPRKARTTPARDKRLVICMSNMLIIIVVGLLLILMVGTENVGRNVLQEQTDLSVIVSETAIGVAVLSLGRKKPRQPTCKRCEINPRSRSRSFRRAGINQYQTTTATKYKYDQW